MFKQSPIAGPGTETATVHALEMIIMLVVAFALGYLLSRFLTLKERVKLAALERNMQKISTDNGDLSARLAVLNKERDKLKDRLATAELEKTELKEIVSDLVTSYEAAPVQTPVLALPTEKDALKKIEGIGPKIETILHQLVTTYEAAPSQIPASRMPADKDNLKKIEGIGPKIEAILHKEGITTFVRLADTTETTLKEILLRQGERYRIHNPKTWPQQAALARDDKWDELKALQDELRGGREK